MILLVHGLLDSSRTWRKLAPVLALGHTVIAPDLLGHGESDGPHDGRLLARRARRACCATCSTRSATSASTVVGHSLGGGIAMTFAYHYPERVERLALISSGGLGRDVSPALRAATLPGRRRGDAHASAPARRSPPAARCRRCSPPRGCGARRASRSTSCARWSGSATPAAAARSSTPSAP